MPVLISIKVLVHAITQSSHKSHIKFTWRCDLVCWSWVGDFSDRWCSIWVMLGELSWHGIFGVCIVCIVVVWCSFFDSRLDDFGDGWMNIIGWVFVDDGRWWVGGSVSGTYDLGDSSWCVICVSFMIVSFGWTFSWNRSDSYSENCSENLRQEKKKKEKLVQTSPCDNFQTFHINHVTYRVWSLIFLVADLANTSFNTCGNVNFLLFISFSGIFRIFDSRNVVLLARHYSISAFFLLLFLVFQSFAIFSLKYWSFNFSTLLHTERHNLVHHQPSKISGQTRYRFLLCVFFSFIFHFSF